MAPLMSARNRLGRSRGIFVIVSVLVLLPIAAGSISRAIAQADAEGDDSLFKHLSVFTEVVSLIQRSYVDETSIGDLFAGAFEGTTDALDPLSTYVPAFAVDDYRRATLVGSSKSGVTMAKDSGITFVIGVEADSPGEAAGLESGDVLAKIDGRSTREIPLWELEILLAGDSGKLELGILRRGQTITATLELSDFTRSQPGAEVRKGVPVVRITHFASDTAQRIEHLLESSEITAAEELILDLRGVAGGSPEAAYETAGLFTRGELGGLRSRSSEVAAFSSDEPPKWEGSAVLLTNGGTQGASEVFVAALKELPNIQVVGSPTFGHAGRQASRPTPGGAVLFYTDAFFFGPDGEILDRGIEPDVVVRPDRPLLLDKDEEVDGDPVLDRALELLLDGAEQSEAA
jgi:carboxyl-terminal processing protease